MIPRTKDGKVDGGKLYRKGVRFERQIVREAKAVDNLAFRSAGSHSPVDVFILDDVNKIVYLIQCKHTKHSQKKLKEKFEKTEGGYTVIWKVLEK